MTRVPYRDTEDGLNEEQLSVFEHIKKSRGKVVGVFSVLLESPTVAGLAADIGAYMRFESILTPVVRELTITTTLGEYSCQFEWSAHEGFARDAGVSDAAIDAIKHKKSLDGLSDIESEIVQYGREMIRDKRISDVTYQAIAARYSTQEVTELTALYCYYSMVSCILNTFEVPPPPGKSAPPEPSKQRMR